MGLYIGSNLPWTARCGVRELLGRFGGWPEGLVGIEAVTDSSCPGNRPFDNERRRFRRYVLPMHVTAVRRSAGDLSAQAQVISLFVRDISKGGLCCVSSETLSRDEEVMLFIPPQGCRGGRDVRCNVTRCEPLENHYRIGLVFRDPLAEAADHLH